MSEFNWEEHNGGIGSRFLEFDPVTFPNVWIQDERAFGVSGFREVRLAYTHHHHINAPRFSVNLCVYVTSVDNATKMIILAFNEWIKEISNA